MADDVGDVGRSPSGPGLRPSDGAAKASPAEPLVPNAGEWIVRRSYSRWSWAGFEVGRVRKVTAKTVEVVFWGARGTRVPFGEIAACFPDEGAARKLAQSLDGVAGTYRDRARAADAEATERKRIAAMKADSAADKLIASAMSAGTAETQSGSGRQPASAVPQGDAQNKVGG